MKWVQVEKEETEKNKKRFSAALDKKPKITIIGTLFFFFFIFPPDGTE